MALDRSDMIGMTATIGIHGALIAVIALGVFAMEEKIEKPQTLTVSLDGEGSPLPLTGEVGEAELAPELTEEAEEALEAAADETAEDSDAAASEAEAAKAQADAKAAEEAAKRADASAADKRKAKEAAERAARKKRDADAAKARKKEAERKKRERDKRERERKKKEAERKERERKEREKRERDRRLGNAVGGGDNAPNAGATRRARASIGGQIRIRGCPSGLDVKKLVTRVTINLNRNGSIASLTNISQSGATASNRPQLEPTKRCILNSIRAAAPFRGLDPADYQSWKSIRIGFKAN